MRIGREVEATATKVGKVLVTLLRVETRPTLSETQPPLTWVSHLWRYALCVAISVAVWGSVAGIEWREHTGLFTVELVLGVASYVLVHFRRRAPVVVALVVAGMSVLSGIAAGPATLAAVSVATRRVSWEVVVVCLANLAAAQAYTSIAPIEDNSPVITTLVILAVNIGMMGWGLYIGSRREIIWSLRTRAERAEREQELRVAQARSTERARIAREMHDVLAHRITQVSMQAGALAFRHDLDGDRLREGLGQIQGQANDALHELRDVLGVLREDDPGPVTARPQPTYDDIAALVDEARTLGLDVDWADDVDSTTPGAAGHRAHGLPDRAGGHHQRAQARPGLGRRDPVRRRPRRRGSASSWPTRWARRPAGAPGAGLGLVGLRERTELRGGRLDQRTEDSTFVLEAWLPWTA